MFDSQLNPSQNCTRQNRTINNMISDKFMMIESFGFWVDGARMYLTAKSSGFSLRALSKSFFFEN